MSDLAKYAKLLGVNPHSELSEIKKKYGEWRQKFEAQLRSENINKAQRGQKNLALLDQAYQALAAHSVSEARKNENALKANRTLLLFSIPFRNKKRVKSKKNNIGKIRLAALEKMSIGKLKAIKVLTKRQPILPKF